MWLKSWRRKKRLDFLGKCCVVAVCLVWKEFTEGQPKHTYWNSLTNWWCSFILMGSQVGAVVSCLAFHLWGPRFWILPGPLCWLGFSVPTWLCGFSLEQFSGIFLPLLKNWNLFIVFSLCLDAEKDLTSIIIDVDRGVAQKKLRNVLNLLPSENASVIVSDL